MNKLLIYILPIIGAFLFACSQQDEASYVQEADEVEISPSVEKVGSGGTYSWQTSTDEQQNNWTNTGLDFDDSEMTEEVIIEGNANTQDISNNHEQGTVGYTTNGAIEISSSVDKNQSTTNIVTKEKVLKAFIKSNTEDILDLLFIYNDAKPDEEISLVARRAIEDFLQDLSFDELQTALRVKQGEVNKLKLSPITLNESGVYQGKVSLKGLDEKQGFSYEIISTETALGISRKFRIVGLY